MGSYCGISDLNAIALANQICAEWGVDTIACGATIAFAMELYENEVINRDDTGGVELKYGNADAMLAMLNQIVRKEGFGAVLAEGSERAAQTIGRGADEYLITVKGTELPAHMPQVKRSLVGDLRGESLRRRSPVERARSDVHARARRRIESVSRLGWRNSASPIRRQQGDESRRR